MFSVLYIDDEPDLLDIVKDYLEEIGEFSIDVALSADEGLVCLDQKTYDAVIADYHLPGMDGIDLLKEIRSRFGDLPFILFTGRGREEVVIEALNAGADFYLQKGGDPEAQFAELAHKVRQAIRGRRAELKRSQSEDKFSRVFYASPSLEAISEFGTGVFLEVNEKFVKTTGYTREEVIGRSSRDLGLFLEYHDRERMAEVLLKNGTIQDIEAKIRTRSGEIRTMNFSGERIEVGGQDLLFSQAIDITDRKAAESSLRENQLQLTNAMDLAHLVKWEYDLASDLFTFNDSFYSLYGTTASREGGYQMPSRTYARTFVHPDDAHLVAKEVKSAMESKDPHFSSQLEHRIVRRDGEVRHIVVRIAGIMDPSGKIVRTFGANQDITDRIKAEKALKESEARFRTLFEISPDGIVLTDLEGRINFASPEALKMFRVPTLEEATGTTIFDWLDPEFHEQAREAITRLLLGKEQRTLDYRVRRRDGEWFYIETSYGIIPGANGRSDGFIIILRDITERQQAQLILAESEEKYRNLFEKMSEGFALHEIVCDDAGKPIDYRFLEINPAFERLTGLKRGDILGMRVSSVLPGDDPIWVERYGNVVLSGRPDHFDHYSPPLKRHYDVFAYPVGDRKFAVLFTDITERKHAEDELKESENKFATVFRSSPVALTLARAADGTFIDVNEVFLNNTGYSREEVIGNTSIDLAFFVHKDEHDRIITLLKEHQSIRSTEVPFRVKSGEIRTCLFSAAIVVMNGKPHVLSTIEDITDRKSSEIAFQAIVRSMVGTTGFDSLENITRNISSWLGADCVMIGMIQPDKMTVKVLSMLLDGKEIPDFSYTLKGTPCDDITDKGFCLYPDNVIQLFPHSKDLVEMNIRGYIGTPLRNSAGDVIGILCVLTRKPIQPSPAIREIMDVIAVKAAAEIERTWMEHAIRESEENFRALVEHSLDGILILDMTGKILFVNRAAGRMVDAESTIERMIGATNVLEFIAPESRDPFLTDFDEILKGIDAYLMNYQFITVTGRRIWVECIGKRILFRSSPAILVSLRDTTSRKRMEDAILRTNKQLNLLSNITRHDVLNKISVIQGYLTVAKKRGPDQDYPAILGKIEAATSAIKSQIEFTRIYQALGTRKPGWQKPATLLPAIQLPASVELKNELGNLEIYADLMLEKVFHNLLDNSLRHGGTVTGISLKTRMDPDGLTIILEDNGTGIPNDEKEKIFECGVGNHTGLGLFLAREILGITGIAIKETGEPGKGARFEILVPKGVFRVPPV